MFDLHHEAMDLGYEVGDDPRAANDDAAERPVIQPLFQFPSAIWALMIGSYTIFLGAMMAMVSGDGFAMMMVVISIFYAMMFFGTASVLVRQTDLVGPSPLEQGNSLPTWCGPMSVGSVYSQVLIVPAMIAFWGVAVLLITRLA